MVKLTDVSPAGDEIIVRLYRPGEIFGERCFQQGAQTCCATALSDSDVLAISARHVIEHVRTQPDTLLELLGELSGRLTDTDAELQAFVSETVVVRLGTTLLALATASEHAREWLDLPHGLRHEEFAQMLGVRRETVSRAFAHLRNLGVVATARGSIRVHRVAMQRFLSGDDRAGRTSQRSMTSEPAMMGS